MLVAAVALGLAPPLALAALLPLGLTLKAGRTLADAVQGRADMRGAIKPTIAAHVLVGLVLVVVFATAAAPPG